MNLLNFGQFQRDEEAYDAPDIFRRWFAPDGGRSDVIDCVRSSRL